MSFWGVYLSFFLYQVSTYQRGDEVDWSRVATIAVLQITFAAIISYLNYFALLPELLAKKKIAQYLLKFAVLFSLVIVLRINVDRFVLEILNYRTHYLYHTRFIVQVVTSNLFIVIFVGMLRFAKDWFDLDAKRKEVEHEKLMAELNFLKAQINPHFLFNTLNNLYYLAYSKSENTTVVIDKLSKMMRYMIYESNHPKVLLSKEIEYIQNYISLEKLRLNDETPIAFEIEGDPGDNRIAPLIFIAFLENAFKHGVANTKKDCWVNVFVKVDEHVCTYIVENSKLSPTVDGSKSGIGLQNIKRRLELSYPGNYELNIGDQPEQYTVELKLNLI